MCEQCSVLDDLVGERVFALREVDQKNKVIKVLGAGVYEGQHVPHWVDLDLLLTTLPGDLREAAQETVEALIRKFNDPEAPSKISNTALGMGLSEERTMKMLDAFLADKKKYDGLTLEDATTTYLKDTISREMKTPRVRLDRVDDDGNVQYVYGTHCMFGREKDMQEAIDQTVAEYAQKGILIEVETVPVPEHADA